VARIHSIKPGVKLFEFVFSPMMTTGNNQAQTPAFTEAWKLESALLTFAIWHDHRGGGGKFNGVISHYSIFARCDEELE
jgi:hypothetical protein